MGVTIVLDAVYMPSEDVVAREIEGQLILVPLKAGVGDSDEDLYALNDTGKAIWQGLDGQRSLRALVELLKKEYDAPASVLEQDVLGLMGELAHRGMVTLLR